MDLLFMIAMGVFAALVLYYFMVQELAAAWVRIIANQDWEDYARQAYAVRMVYLVSYTIGIILWIRMMASFGLFR